MNVALKILKDRRPAYQNAVTGLEETIARNEADLREHVERCNAEISAWRRDLTQSYADLADLDTAIAALEPAPAEPEAETPKPESEVIGYFISEGQSVQMHADGTIAPLRADEPSQAPAQPDPPSAELRFVTPATEEESGDQIAIREGYTKWEGDDTPGNDGPAGPEAFVEVLWNDGNVTSGQSDCYSWLHETGAPNIIAYRIISQPADQSEEEAIVECEAAYERELHESDSETHTDDVRTAEAETVAGDDRTETQSVLDDPDFQARVEAAREQEAAAEWKAGTLQNAELDAEYDAMKARERAAAGKFSAFNPFVRKREEV